MNKLRIMLVFAAVGLGATSLLAHDRAVLLPQPIAQVAAGPAWSATTLDAVPEGATGVSLDAPVHRVVISGYHPLAGFETETAAEHAALATDPTPAATDRESPAR